MLKIAVEIIFLISAISILCVFFLNRLLVRAVYYLKGKKKLNISPVSPAISLITIVRDGDDIIRKKIENSLSLDYPSNDYEIIIFSDGPFRSVEGGVKGINHPRIILKSSEQHQGKNSALNEAVRIALGEVIVFSDADAMLGKDAIMNLAKYFSDESIGGVCGRIIIIDDKADLSRAQKTYYSFDSDIKKYESEIGSVTSNYGVISAVRKRLIQPIPLTVTDDLFIAMSVVEQGFRFVFESGAIAFMKAPSRKPRDEISRRRRIVVRSLSGIMIKRKVLNPYHYGLFSINLLLNKVLRRLLPIFLAALFSSNLFLLFSYPGLLYVLLAQILFYLSAVLYYILSEVFRKKIFANSFLETIFYFCMGNIGTFMGLIDFLKGKRVVKWGTA